jgi:hypothetical protein
VVGDGGTVVRGNCGAATWMVNERPPHSMTAGPSFMAAAGPWEWSVTVRPSNSTTAVPLERSAAAGLSRSMTVEPSFVATAGRWRGL